MKNSELTRAPRRRQALPMLEGSGTRKLGGRDSFRALHRGLSVLIVTLFVSLFPTQAHAYAWMIKHGYSGCPVCHADPSGGELLTAYGRAQSDLLLRMHYGSSASGAASSSAAPSSDSPADDSASSPASDKASAPSTETPTAAPDADADAPKTDAESGEDEGDAPADDAAPSDEADATKKKPAPAAAAPAPAKERAKEESSAGGGEEGGGMETSGFLWGLVKTPDWLLLGGSYRHLSVYKPHSAPGSGAVLRKGYFVTFPMMADVYGQIQIGGFRVEGSLGVIRVGVGSPYGRGAQITTGQGDQWNLLSRTHWVGYDFGDGKFTLRAGHLNLPFGIRIPEHTMWVRQYTRSDRESAQQDGVALAFNGEDWRAEVMGIVGNYQVNPDKYRERGYSGYVEYMASPHTAIGLSSLVSSAKEDRISLELNSTRQAHGVMVRAALSEKTALLTEADMLIRTYHETGYVGFAQLDYEAVQGLHLMATGEIHDEGYDSLRGGNRLAGSGQPQFGGWATIDWFCLPHVELRADVLSRQGDEITALGQLHVFL